MIMRLALIAAVLALAGVPQQLLAQDFYRGKGIKLIIGSQVGASYDSYARILARHMPRHIPGQARIIAQNLPSSEGLVAANSIYNLAERDGTVMAILNRSSVLAALIGNEQARYKAERFNWLGTPASFEDNAYLFVIRAALPYQSVEALRAAPTPLHVGNSGSPLITLLKHGLSLNVNIVEGYGKNELDLAFERGEVDGVGIAYANLIARHPHWLERKLVRPLIQFGRVQRFAPFPDVPTAREVARNAEERGLIELAEASLLIAYPFALPPMVPPERVAIIRRAFTATMNDPNFRADIATGKLDYSPKDGDEVQATIASMANMPPEAIARYKQIVLSNKAGE
jgi:tripartite-type tricarboxylate transporter receptor subunit TctC